MKYIIEKFEYDYRDDILDVWEASVRATHTFLKEEDIEFYKNHLKHFDFELLHVDIAIGEDGNIIGFMGIQNRKLEMLFIHPDYIGLGFGKKLLEYAMNLYRIEELDVNADNLSAIEFYSRFGFQVIDEKPVDNYNKPYPILTMRVERLD